MNIAQNMAASFSTKSYRSRSLSAIHKATSNSGQANSAKLTIDTTKEGIRKMFKSVKLSVSSYDAAWVAMVPSPNSPKSPCFPFDLYIQLSMVDTLGRLGIAHHFTVEIKNVLDETHRCWVERDEQIFMDVETCALAFRLLRINGYEVSSEPLAEITNEVAFKDEYAALEVYHASQILYEEESSFGEQILRSVDFLKRILSTDSNIHGEVDNALKFPFNTCLERINTRRNIECYNVDDTRILKTTYCSSNITNKDYLRLAVEDFNTCQSIFRDELEGLERWVVENKVDQLKFVRQKTAYSYFSIAASLPSPELSDARISWAKSVILTTVLDDLFDVGGTMNEFANLIQCVEKWNVDVENDFCSEQVRIAFLALKDLVCWIRDATFKWQARDVTSHLIQSWLDVMNSMLREAIWTRDAYVPTINEYMENGCLSFAFGPVVLSTLYCVGPKLSDEIVKSSEYRRLFELVSTQGRLLNDIHSLKRELKVGKLNAVALHMSNRERGNTEEEVVKEMKMMIQNKRREVMKLVMEEKGSIVPRACRYVFWDTCNALNLFYKTDDGFSGDTMFDVMKDVVYNPLVLANGSAEQIDGVNV